MPILSQKELDLSDEVYFFLEKLITKFFEDENAKTAEFTRTDQRLPEICRGLTHGLDFMAGSIEIANLLFTIMQANPSIVPADLVCMLFSRADQLYLGIFKLNYRTGYIHNVISDAGVSANSLIKQQTVLPSETQRLEEAAAIRLDDFQIRLVEKEYEINGTKDYYLSKLFLGCNGQLSNNQKARLLEKATKKISKKYYDDDFEKLARFRQAVAAEAENAAGIQMEQVVREVFRDDPPAQREYLEEVKKAGLVETRVKLPEKLIAKRFGTQKILTDTGVEINFPSDYFNNQEKLEFINNSDGTISIVIKNVSKISNK